jgi:hypothetical protein
MRLCYVLLLLLSGTCSASIKKIREDEMFEDVVQAFNGFGAPVQQLSRIYEIGREKLEKAVQVDLMSGATKVDREALRIGLEDFSAPLSQKDIERLVQNLELGYMVENKEILAPWCVFRDERLSKQLDRNAWKAFGIQSDSQIQSVSKTIGERFPAVPAAVLDQNNLRRLTNEAQYAEYLANNFQARLSVRSILRFKENIEPHEAGGTTSPGTPVVRGILGGLSLPGWDEIETGISCFVNADWSVSWAHLNVCMDRRCADVLEGILFGSTAGSLAAGVTSLIAGQTVRAIVSSWGGWFAAAIIVSAAYWGLMIKFNKTPRGVCLVIPLPVWFGITGPGWARGL